MQKKLVLLGGGHSHIHLLKMLYKHSQKDLKVIMISKSKMQYYSGMASMFLEGEYKESECAFNLAKLCEIASVSFIVDEATRIDYVNKKIYTKTGYVLDYDMLSVNVGSYVNPIEGDGENIFYVKPLSSLDNLLEKVLLNKNTKKEIVIAGAGMAGVEIALSLYARKIKEGLKIKIILVHSKNRLLAHQPIKASSIVEKLIQKTDIECILKTRLKSANNKVAYFDNGEKLKYDYLIVSTGSKAPKIFNDSLLKVDEDGYLLMKNTLQSLKFKEIFGSGDCISFIDYPFVKKVGVYAVKEAPVLFENIVRFSKNLPLKKYIPQKKYLALLSLGNRQALFIYSRIVLKGRWVYFLKKLIDEGFIKKYQFGLEE